MMEFLSGVKDWVVDKVVRLVRWVCSWVNTWVFRVLTVIVILAGAAIFVWIGWTIFGAGAGIVVFVIGVVMLIMVLVCAFI